MARYVTVGPFAFKQKKGSKSVKTLKPVASPKETRRAFAQTGSRTAARRARQERLAAKRAAREAERDALVRKYFGLRGLGYGQSDTNPLRALLGGKQRLTTPQERSQKVLQPQQYHETPFGFAVVGRATEKRRKSPANRFYERATGINTGSKYANYKGRPLKAYGTTTEDEVGKELRKQSFDDAKYRRRTQRLKAEQRKNNKKIQSTLYGQLASGKAAQSGLVPQALNPTLRKAKKVNKEIHNREIDERATQAEGMLAALDNISRPYYGVNAAAKATVQGKNPASAAWKGVKLEDRTESWDVLDAVGVKNKWIKYGVGIPAAFASDPLSYISLAAAPETGGASLAAMSPKFTKLSRLLAKAEKAQNVAASAKAAKAAEEAVGTASKKAVARFEKAKRKAKKARTKADRFAADHKIQQGPMRAEDAYKQAISKRGVKVRAGVKVPFSQKFLGGETSGRMTRRFRNEGIGLSKDGYRIGGNKSNFAGPASDLRDAWVRHMSPTGRMSGLTREQSDTLTRAVASENAEEARGGVERKLVERGMSRAALDEAGVSRIRQVLRPFKTKRMVREISRDLHHAADEGKSGKVLDYGDQFLDDILEAEQKAGLGTPEYRRASRSHEEALDVLDDFMAQTLRSQENAYNYAKSGRADKPVQRGQKAERSHTHSANTTAIRQSMRLTRSLREQVAGLRHADWGPDDLRALAKDGRIEDDVRATLRRIADNLQERIEAAPARYAPRNWQRDISTKAHKHGKKADELDPLSRNKGTSPTNPQRGFAQMRTEERKMGDIPIEKDAPDALAHDYIGNVAKRRQDSIEAIARKRTNDVLVGLGRKAPSGITSKDIHRSETIYEYKRGVLKPVDAVPETTAGDYYIIPDAVKARADELRGGAKKDAVGIGKFFDRMTGRWKGSVTVAWPGYYLRNLVGDSMLARQAGTDAKSAVGSVRIARANMKRNKVIRKGKNITKGANPDEALERLTFKINGKTYTGKELEDLAMEHGAISMGQHGSEITQLVGKDSFSATNAAARGNIHRENAPRRATFLAAMKRGDSPEEAAAFARKEHYDYATRTEFQKQARRIIPFFAWWDLNTRKQLKQLVTRPGKMTEIYHVLNGASSAAGYEDYRDYLASLPAGKQRGLPIPIVYGHDKDGKPKVKDVQFGNVLSDVRTALTGSPSKWMDELLSRGNPIVTKPVEISNNHSGFFRGEIEPSYAPLTKAPKALAKYAGKSGIDTNVEKMLNTELIPRTDRKTGKKVLMWRKKTDYALRSLGPWASFGLNQAVGNDAGRFNKSKTDTLLGLSGVAPSEHEAYKGQLDKLYARRSELQKIYDGLAHVQGGKIRRKGLTRRMDALTNEISRIEKKAGYAIPLNVSSGKAKKKKPLTPAQQLRKEIFGTTKDPAEEMKKELQKEIFGTDKNPMDELKKELENSVNKKPKKNSAKVNKALSNKDGLPPDVHAAAAKYGPKINALAKSRYGVDGETLLLKVVKGESGGNAKSVSSAGARGLTQFMPGSRQEAIRKYGVDPWKDADSAVHAAVLHLQGKINGSKGLEGYNPGMSTYPQYILKQAVATGGKAGGGSGSRPKLGPHSTKYVGQTKGLSSTARETMRAIASRVKFTPEITSGSRPGSITTTGNVSDHDSGNGMDLGVGGDIRGGGGNERKGDALAAAALRTAGMSAKEARAAAKKGGVWNVNRNGVRYQIIWKSNTGGNHYNHVHVGVKGGAGADSSAYSGGGGGYSGGSGGATYTNVSGGSSSGKKRKKSGNGYDEAERVMALMQYIQTKDKSKASRKLLQDYSIGKVTTI